MEEIYEKNCRKLVSYRNFFITQVFILPEVLILLKSVHGGTQTVLPRFGSNKLRIPEHELWEIFDKTDHSSHCKVLFLEYIARTRWMHQTHNNLTLLLLSTSRCRLKHSMDPTQPTVTSFPQ